MPLSNDGPAEPLRLVRRIDAERGELVPGTGTCPIAAVVLAAGAVVALRNGSAQSRRCTSAQYSPRSSVRRRRDRRRQRRAPAAGREHPLRRLGTRARRVASRRARSARDDVEAAVVALADGPDLDPRAVDRVVADWRANGGDVVAATYGGVRLHPVLLARAAWASIPDEGARSLPARLVPCDDLTPPGDVDFSPAGS